jgi:hypothetical protein
MHDDQDPDAQAQDPGAGPWVPAGPAPPPSPLPELALWAVLALVCAGLFTLTLLAPPAEDPGGAACRLELRFQGRYAVGVKTLLQPLGEKFAANVESQLLAQVRTLAETPKEKLCLLPVVAELTGTDEARAEIDELRREPQLPDDVERDLDLLERLYAGGRDELTAEERAGFVERREWFARLALSQGADPQDPEREAVVSGALKVAVLMIVLLGGVTAAGFAGLGLLAAGVVLARRGRLRAHYEAPPERGAAGAFRRLPFLETVVVFILVTIGVSLLSGAVLEATGSEPVALLVNLLAVPAVLWPWLRRVGTEEVRRAYGWHRGAGVLREIGWGLVGYVAGAPFLILGILASLLLSTVVGQEAHHPLMDSVAEAGVPGMVAIFLLACVSAPLVEETVFRGGFYHYLRGRLGIPGAALLVSLVFAFIHPQGILGVPPLVALALVLAFIREWRGSIVGCVAVHAVHNGLATTVLFVMLN